MMQPVEAGPSSETATVCPLPENRLLRVPVYLRQSSKELAQALGKAADAGFHGVVVPMALGGLPLFPSEVPEKYDLQRSIPQFKRRDVLGEIISVAEQRNLGVWVYVNPWRASGDLSPDKTTKWFRRRLTWFATGPRWKGIGRVAPAARGFCPVNNEIRRYWGDLIAEMVEAYPLEGMTFEMPEPPFSLVKGRERCFCPTCRQYAMEHFGIDLTQLPDNLHRQDLRDGWRHLQSERLLNWVAYLCQRGRKTRRDLLIHMKTRPVSEQSSPPERKPAPEQMDAPVEQLIRPLLAQGIINALRFCCPSGDDSALEETLELNLATWPDDSALYTSIETSRVADVARILQLTRSLPMMGIEVDLQGTLHETAAMDLSRTCFQQPAFPPENKPIENIALLFEEITRLAPPDSGVREFLADLLIFARAPSEANPMSALDALVQNLRGLEARILQGQVEFGQQATLALCRVSQAKRLARLASHRLHPTQL